MLIVVGLVLSGGLWTAQPLTLEEAARRALERSEAVKIAKRDVEEADLRVSRTWTEWGPVFELSGGGSIQNQIEVGGEIYQSKMSAFGRADLVQPLFRLSFFDARRAAKADLERSEAQLARAKEQVMRDVASVFLGLLRARKLIDVSRAAVDRAKVQLEHASGRVKAGGALKNAELLARIELKRAELRLVTAESDARAAEILFQRVVGEPPPAELSREPPPPLMTLEEALKQLGERKDIEALRNEALAAEARVEQAASYRLWPRLDARGTLLGILDDADFTEDFSWQAQGVLTIPLFQTGLEYSEIDLAKNEAVRAKLRIQQQLELAEEEVRAAMNRVRNAEEAAVLSKEQVDAAREHYKLVETQFRLGAVTFLDVATAQTALTEAESLHEVVMFEREIAAYDLLFAVGALSL